MAAVEPPTEAPTPRHLTLAELNDGLTGILLPPQDEGRLAVIVIRPEQDTRRTPSLAQGTHGDRWPRAGDKLFIGLDLSTAPTASGAPASPSAPPYAR